MDQSSRVTWEWVSDVTRRVRGETLVEPVKLRANELRRYTPTLRHAAKVLVTVSVGLVLTGCATWLISQQLKSALEDRLILADQALSQALYEIDFDLQSVPDGPSDQCTPEMRESITRASLNSVLVRDFWIQSAPGMVACSSFGQQYAFWREVNTSNRKLEVMPAQRIRDGIVVVRNDSQSFKVAFIEPRQLLDRLPQGSASQKIVLLNTQNTRLASIGPKDDTKTFGMMIHELEDWDLRLQGSIDTAAILQGLKSQAIAWGLLWLVLSTITIMACNQRLAFKASRAAKLHRALRKRRFAPVVQPIVNAQTGRCEGMEILMRWKHPQRGLVAPAEFIDYAERSGLIVPMSDLMMRQACLQLAALARAYPHLYFSFNVTPQQLQTEGFRNSLLAIFDREPIGPERVVLELTERDLVNDDVRDELMRIRAQGFRIAVDDFGTGQSSLALLQDMHVDLLKIDRAFVQTIGEGSQDQPVLDAIIGLAHRLNLKMVGEGIETPGQQAYLREHGVQSLQGYRFARPMPTDDFERWIAQHERPAGHTGHSGLATPTLEMLLEALDQARDKLASTQTYRFRRYRNVIPGDKLVTWLCEYYSINRGVANKLGRQLVAHGFLVHVHSEHDFEDSPLFYRLVPRISIDEELQAPESAMMNPAQLMGWLRGPRGVAPGYRVGGFFAYRDVISGAEVVAALQRCGGLDAQAARAAGTQLMRTGHLRHVFDEKGFENSPREHYHFAR